MRHIAHLSNTFSLWFGTFTMSIVIWERSSYLTIKEAGSSSLTRCVRYIIQLLLCRLLTNEPCPEFRQKYYFHFYSFYIHIYIWTILPKMHSMKIVNNVAFLLKNTLLRILHSNECICPHQIHVIHISSD